MDDCYFSAIQDDGSYLCLAPLTDRRIAMSGQEVDDPSGIFLFHQRGSDEAGEVHIIARVLTEEAALMFRALFNMTTPVSSFGHVTRI